MSDNPYEGIADSGFGSWAAKPGEQRPLCVEDLENLRKQMIEKDEDDFKRMRAWGEKMERLRKKNPRRFEAEMQAALEMFGRIGDPVNPLIISPKQYERWQARAEELFAEPQPFRAGG